MENPLRTVIACRDLLSYSRVAAAVRAAGHTPIQTEDLEALKREAPLAVCVIADLQDGAGGIAAVDAARQARDDLTIVAIGPHVATELLAAAKSAGATHVLTHGVVDARLPRILADIEPHIRPPGRRPHGPPVPERPSNEPPGGPTGKHA